MSFEEVSYSELDSCELGVDVSAGKREGELEASFSASMLIDANGFCRGCFSGDVILFFRSIIVPRIVDASLTSIINVGVF